MSNTYNKNDFEAGRGDSVVKESVPAYLVEQIAIDVDQDNRLQRLFEMTQGVIESQGDKMQLYREWRELALSVMQDFDFSSLHPYESLIARINILYGLKQYNKVVELVDASCCKTDSCLKEPREQIWQYGQDGVMTFNFQAMKPEGWFEGQEGLGTPRALAFKAYALANLGGLDNAINVMRQAAELCFVWNAESETRKYSSTCRQTITRLFAAKDCCEQVLKEGSIWRGCYSFASNEFNEKLIYLYAFTFCDYDHSDDFDPCYQKVMAEVNKDAVAVFKELFDVTPNHWFLQYCYAQFLIMSNNPEEALAYLDRSIKANSQFCEAYLQRAQLYKKKELYIKALNDLDEAVKLNDEFAEAFFRRGTLKLLLSNLAGACEDFDRAQKIKPLMSKKVNFRELEQAVDENSKKEKIAYDNEREEVVRNLVHTLKNLTASVIEPLRECLKDEAKKNIGLKNAFRGMDLVRESTNALSLSFRGEPEDFKYDAKISHGVPSYTMLNIILNGLASAVDCMLDGRNFSEFFHNYFPSRDKFITAKDTWSSVDKESVASLRGFFNELMFKFSIEDIDELRSMQLNDSRNSPLKLTLLFKEWFLNALKHASNCGRMNRFVNIRVRRESGCVYLEVNHSYVEGKSAKISKAGREIVNNIIHALPLGNYSEERSDGEISTVIQMEDIFVKQLIKE